LIARSCRCVPRACLNFLLKHCIIGGTPVSHSAIEKIIGGKETLEKEEINDGTVF
jgi:hypothetical protein